MRPLPSSEIRWRSHARLVFYTRHEPLVAALGAPHEVHFDVPGIGYHDGWAFTADCGLEFSITIRTQLIRGDGLAEVAVFSPSTDVAHLLSHLPPLADPWHPEHVVAPRLAWKLMRQDDNGNRAEMQRFTTQCEAKKHAQIFEDRGHKQMYWAEEVEP